MTTETPALTPGRNWPRAEWTLALLAFLSLFLNFVHITTIYEGLPAHPLFLHVPVVLIPVATIGALVLSIKPKLFERYGVLLAAITVIALTGLCLTEGAGSAFEQALGLSSNGLVAQHVHAAHILRLLFIAFTAVVLVTLLAHRRPTGIGPLDVLLARDWVRTGLRIAVWALAIASLFYVWRTGDLGAKAVWQARLHHGGGLFPGGGGFPGPPPGG